MIRAFIALTPPATLQQAFAEVQAALHRLSLPFRWVKPAQIHLTLKFLGDILPETIDPIAQAIRQTVITCPPFTLSVRGLGCFPNSTSPRILWMGQQRVNSRQLATVMPAYGDQYFGEMLVEHVLLYQSQLHRDGAVYTMLRSVALQQ
jgi:2'-5' RNA ligase